MAIPRKFAALDTDFLLLLIGEFDGIPQETVDRLGKEGFDLLVTPTVRQELTDIMESGEDAEIQDLAKRALESFGSWGVLEDSLTKAQARSSDDLCEMLQVTQVIDGGLDTDTPRRIVAEAAVLECILLVTERTVLKAVNNLTLGFALLRENAKDVVIKSPKQILDGLGPLG